MGSEQLPRLLLLVLLLAWRLLRQRQKLEAEPRLNAEAGPRIRQRPEQVAAGLSAWAKHPVSTTSGLSQQRSVAKVPLTSTTATLASAFAMAPERSA